MQVKRAPSYSAPRRSTPNRAGRSATRASSSKVQNAARRIARGRLAESLHDLSDGGLATAAAESTFGPERVGAALHLESDLPTAQLLFHEAPSRVLLSVTEEHLDRVLQVAKEEGAPALVVGRTGGDELKVSVNGEELFSTAVDDLFQAWDTALEGMLGK